MSGILLKPKLIYRPAEADLLNVLIYLLFLKLVVLHLLVCHFTKQRVKQTERQNNVHKTLPHSKIEWRYVSAVGHFSTLARLA